MSTQQQVVLVTGASSGIGRASAEALRAAGLVVVGTSRNPAPGSGLARLDVTDPESVEECVADVVATHGRIDVLVNNAGVGAVGAFEEATEDEVAAVFDTNVHGVLRMTRAVLPHMRAAGSGRIVTISSVLGLMPAPYLAAYAATKHAVEGFSESLDHEVREHGIRAVLVEPAYTRTGFEEAAARPVGAIADYARQGAVAVEVLQRAMDDADDPAVVGAVVVRAATDPSPRLRYPAGPLARRVVPLRRYVPSRLFDRQVRRLNRLP
ncbi:MAG: oxidoreductase [Aeromicrobium erythreum]